MKHSRSTLGSPQRTKVTCTQNSAVIGLDHQLMSFSQDPIGSAIGSANAITVRSGLNPWGQLIGRSSDRLGIEAGEEEGGWGVSVVLSRHSLTPPQKHSPAPGGSCRLPHGPC